MGIFAGSEIVTIGIQIEKNGRDFYQAVARTTAHSAAQKIFVFLAQEEERHITAFQSILEKVEHYEPVESYPDEYFAYMRSLAGEHIFTRENSGEEAARGVVSDLDALEKAIGFEKESIIFYVGMKKIVPAHDQKTVDALIEQEHGHLRQLMGLKKDFAAYKEAL